MNILVVDDDTVFGERIAMFIARLGHEVFLGANGREALDVLSRERIHLVFTDIQMPVMDGHELLGRIRKEPRLKDTLVIILTGFGNVRDAVESMRSGAYDYILKPVNLNELEIAVRKAGEYLALREENTILTTRFNDEVHRAVSDIRKELDDLKKLHVRGTGRMDILVKSKKFKAVIAAAQKLHPRPEIPVLIEGETGTGKEIVARLVHYGERGNPGPFIALNCAIITSSLFESELFGYEAGAFTGGNPKGQKGKIEMAENGTVFLDEITELPLNFQAKLLRVMQEREYYRVGGVRALRTNARFICATNRDIRESVAKGLFRDDLFFRLNVGHVSIPPLRERCEEIIPFCRMFLDELMTQGKTRIRDISPEAETVLMEYSWPGNVRELKNTLERVSLFCDDRELLPGHLTPLLSCSQFPVVSASPVSASSGDASSSAHGGLDKMVADTVRTALELHHGNKTAAARYLGISLRVLQTRLKHLK